MDHTSQSHSYTGQYSKEGNSYAGTYTVDKGKQLVTVPNCIRYHIAPNGTWRIFALSETFSEASSHQPISVADGIARWAIPPGAAMASVSLVDKALATSGAKNAVLYQQMIPATLKQFRLPAKYAKSGKTYIASVLASNGRELVYFSSTEFPKSAATAPTPTIHLGNPAASTEGSNSSAPHTMGSTKPDPQPANDQPNVCAGLYQGHYDGALAGIMSVQVGEQSENLSGFAATGGYNGSMRFEDQARKTEMQGVKRFQFVTGSAGKACHYSFSGTWAAPIHSVDPKRTQRMYFSGRADGQNMRGEYRFDKNVNSRPMGTFTLRKVN